MQRSFNSKASRSAAEKALKAWNIKYKKMPGGSILVPDDLDISSKDLTALPDLSQVIVGGDFNCHGNLLTSLKGAPQSVGGNFYCHDNKLTSLEHSPPAVGGGFFCDMNRLTSLKGAPRSVEYYFDCSNNLLETLEHAPETVGGRYIRCGNNQLTSLEGVPKDFMYLTSDFGEFTSWKDVPEHLRVSQKTKERLEQERRATSDVAIDAATVLQGDIRVSKPLNLKIKRAAS